MEYKLQVKTSLATHFLGAQLSRLPARWSCCYSGAGGWDLWVCRTSSNLTTWTPSSLCVALHLPKIFQDS